MRQLIEAGAHFGHNTRRWNPKMKPYLFGVRDGVHIIDLQQSVPMLQRAMQAIHDVTAAGGRVLFVGTKRQAQELVKEYAERCGQYFVNHRWLGGTLTNWKTVSHSIKRLKDLEARLGDEQQLHGLTKKEQLELAREQEKLNRSLGGIKDMGGLPDILFVIDTNKESIAVNEARVLGLPVVAILDSNSDPAHITYPVPGNDDAIRAIKLYCELVANTVLTGIKDEMKTAGVDIGAQENAPAETLPEGDEGGPVVVKKPRSRAPRAKKEAEGAQA
ncbi:MAG: 30S ribosomal protein S2 [Rhodospirillaceae bacterium]|nr:30S ribosomal protein S2 [Rhodospirillaceae bacterium]